MKTLLLITLTLFSLNINSGTFRAEKYEPDVNITLRAVKAFMIIAKIESDYDTSAYCKKENAKTILQIRKPMIKEANRLLEREVYDTLRITNREAVEIFTIVQNHYNPGYNLKLAAFVHNTGSVDTTGRHGGVRYWGKVCKVDKFM